ncbi:hypothetical protein FSP39_020310 [Pinctada imbricata]|uniref:G-protein coupled receptors family 1 profile domain-containing protein n=1 Tax=Pinctada imbricata TaxID=66713 RepID=A0AA89CE49_PINIB|nr:hypothetical protein FSP39_020310 [Pinctada imbricata]
MERFPTWLTIVFTSLLVTESVVGVFLNLYCGLKRKTTKRAKGNRFTPMLTAADALTGCITIPLLVSALFTPADDSLRWLCMATEVALVTTTVGTMVIMTCTCLDRYSTIAQTKINFFTEKRINVFKCIVFVVSIIGFLLPVISTSILDENSLMQTTVRTSRRCRHRGPIFFEFYVLLFYLVAFVTTIITYVQIMKVITRLSPPKVAPYDRERRVSQQKKKRTMRVSLTTICSATFLWLPFIVTYVTRAFMVDSQSLDVAYMVSMIIAFSTIVWNPILNAIIQGRVGREEQRRRTTVVPMKVFVTSNTMNTCLNSAFSLVSASTGAQVDKRHLPKISKESYM